MSRNPEHVDLRWVPPASFSPGRGGGQPSLIVMHTTEGAARAGAAEDGAAYDQRRTDGTSAHYYVDSVAVVQCVRTSDRAHTARATGNARGIHYELCGRAHHLDWTSDYANAMLNRAARQAARDARRYAIPLRRLTISELRAGKQGFCGHVDISNAFHESDHTDPGSRFPWVAFLARVRDYMTQGENGVSAKDVIEALKSTEGRTALAVAAWGTDDVIAAPGAPKPGTNPDGKPVNTHWSPASYLRDVQTKVSRLELKVDALARALTTLAAREHDTAALARELAAAVVAALPADRDDITREELTEAIRALVAPAAP